MPGRTSFKSESEFIAWIRRRIPVKAAGLRLGIGDDAALLSVPRGKELILTTDMSIEDVHFTPGLHPPRAIGHRALARSLSDVAAMGGSPRYALISLAISKQTDRRWLQGFFQGFLTLARRFAIALIGGDTALLSGPVAADVIVAGVIPRGQALRRSTARPGDRIFVSGRLGMSAFGLRLLRSRVSRPNRTERTAVHAHLFPEPQCALGQLLARRRLASAMMDLSDGLSADLRRICDASGTGATIFAPLVPAPPILDRQEALSLALQGGEDYQLLFTVPKSKVSRIPQRFGSLPVTCIGQIVAGTEIRLVDSDGTSGPFETGGYDHFRR